LRVRGRDVNSRTDYRRGLLEGSQPVRFELGPGRNGRSWCVVVDKHLVPGRFELNDRLFKGLSWEEANARVPSDIAVACHNSDDGVTISGPPDSISNFVDKLKAEGVFAREVNSSGVAFHSWYIAAAGPAFRKNVSGVCFRTLFRRRYDRDEQFAFPRVGHRQSKSEIFEMDQYVYPGVQMERTVGAVFVRGLPRQQFGVAGVV